MQVTAIRHVGIGFLYPAVLRTLQRRVQRVRYNSRKIGETLLAGLCLGLSRYAEGNETRISIDSWCTHRTGGEFLHLDAGGSAAEHGDRCGNAETRQARSEVDAAAQSARGRRANSHTRKARSGVFSEIGVANTMHVVVPGRRVPGRASVERRWHASNKARC